MSHDEPKQPFVETNPHINLPAIIETQTGLPKNEVKKTIRDLGSFLEDFIKVSTVDGENKMLDQITRTFLDDTGQLIDHLKTLRRIQRDRRTNGKSIAYYLEEKRILKLISTSNTKTTEITELLADLIAKNTESIEQSSSLSSKVANQNHFNDTLLQNRLTQTAKTRIYIGHATLLDQNRTTLIGIESIIWSNLQQQEKFIYSEYHQKATEIDLVFKRSPLYEKISFIRGIKKLLVIAETQDNQIHIKPPTLQESPEEVNDSTIFKTKFRNPGEILQFHQFDIEDPKQYPDYQIAEHYLLIINTWVNEHLSIKNHQVSSQEIKGISKLTKILLKTIKPDLQSKWMIDLILLLNQS